MIQRIIRAIAVIVIITILLGISFSIIIALRLKALANSSKYAVGDCTVLNDMYTFNLMKDYSIDEWYDFYKPVNGTKATTRIGSIVDCFCKDQKKKIGFGGLMKTNYTESSGQRSSFLCYEWLVDTYTAKVYGIIVSLSINIINVILKMILIALITAICEDEKSA